MTYRLALVFVNKVLLEHRHTHLFDIVCGCFHDTMTELSCCNRNSLAQSLKYVLSGPLSLLTLGLKHCKVNLPLLAAKHIPNINQYS